MIEKRSGRLYREGWIRRKDGNVKEKRKEAREKKGEKDDKEKKGYIQLDDEEAAQADHIERDG